MIRSLGRRLRLLFGERADPTDAGVDPATHPYVPAPPVIDFVAYGEDCLISGRIRLPADRLTDLLNEHDEYELVEVLVEPLDGSGATEVPSIIVARDDVLMVQATGPRGARGRRQRTRPWPMAMGIGPYRVLGHLHVLPGANPVAAMRRRRPIVALTDARIELTVGGVLQQRTVGTLLVNREQVDWVAQVDDGALGAAEPPAIPAEAGQGPLVKDFTGDILVMRLGDRPPG